MKKIIIVFNNNAYVNIYDCNNLVFEGVTCNNKIELCLEECKAYRLEAISNNIKLVTSFYVNCNNIYRFSFINNDNNPITFLLTDYYYNLPIERGELLLWQNQ